VNKYEEKFTQETVKELRRIQVTKLPAGYGQKKYGECCEWKQGLLW
jgi:hypothetical protein